MTRWRHGILCLALALLGAGCAQGRAVPALPSRPQAPVTYPLHWPVTGPILSGFGESRGSRSHKGLDIRAPRGTPVRAAAAGRVSFSGTLRGFGKVVMLDHADGLRTVYAHHRANRVRKGARVAAGQVIAESGQTGNATTPHLHFEVRQDGRSRDPLRYLGKQSPF